MKTEEVFWGSELKLNIHIDEMDGMTMDDYDFIVNIYCAANRSQTVKKDEAIRVDNNNYIVLVDTSKTGLGSLICKVTAYLPDGDFPDEVRKEIVIEDTGIKVVR